MLTICAEIVVIASMVVLHGVLISEHLLAHTLRAWLVLGVLAS